MPHSNENAVSPVSLLLPMGIIALTLLGLIGFQTTAIIEERNNLKTTLSNQDKPLEQGQKVQVQLDALATGTLKLAKQGNKDAQNIVARLKQAGVTIAPNNAKNAKDAGATDPEPAATPDDKTDEAPTK